MKLKSKPWGLVFSALSCLLVLIGGFQATAFGQAQCLGAECFVERICAAGLCFRNPQDEARFEKEQHCKFGELCGNQVFKPESQCCGRDLNGQSAIQPKVAGALNPKFNWANYQKMCPNMRQSEAPPDATWRQCVVGQRHDPATDDWNILAVQPNLANPKARSYCVDGCSTPRAAVETLFNLGIFLVADKDNPTGFPEASFVSACSAHDVCYQTCGAAYDQTTCDDRLLADSLRACEVIPRDHTSIDASGDVRNTFRACRNAANKMNTGLYLGGAKAFATRKQQYCQCC